MRRKGLEEKVRKDILAAGLKYEEEIEDFLVSGDVAASLQKHDKALGRDAEEVLVKLNNQFPKDVTIDIDHMIKCIERALADRFAGKFPCSLLILDEAQQYINTDSDRGYKLQLVVEALSSRLCGKLIVVATGQSALNTSPLLSKLQDRFTRVLHLQDNDIETVIRKVVLQKKPDKKANVQEVLSSSEGEITRQLQGTRIEATVTDKERYVEDYPVLPVRQRFWEKVLRNMDTGLTGQLRTQLRITHEAVRSVADKPLGHVIPADILFDQLADALVEKNLLDRERHNMIQRLRTSVSADDQLAGRLFALIFMIAKINQSTRDTPGDLGIRATPGVLSDLLVEDLKAGGTGMRERVPRILAEHEAKGSLLRVGEEYRLQTPESAAWEQSYRQRLVGLMNNDGEIAFLRGELFRREIGSMLDDVVLRQGKSKVKRDIQVSFTDTPPATDVAVPVWVRTGWDVSEKPVLNEAHTAGVQSPRVTIFIPFEAKDELKLALAAAKAAELTLQERGTPTTLAGIEAHDAITSRRTLAEQEAKRLLYQQILPHAKVILAGSEEFPGITLTDKARAAAEAALARLYPGFAIADSDRWSEVFKQAKAGGGSPLQVVNHNGDPEKHPVCKAILDEIGPGKKGQDIIGKFTKAPFGWDVEAIRAGIMVLIASGLLRASRNGQPVLRQAIEQGAVGPLELRVDHPPISAGDKIKLRGLYQKVAVKCASNDDVEAKANEFLAAVHNLTESAGGDAPLPERPNLAPLKALQSIAGNEQLTAILAASAQLEKDIANWQKRKQLIDQRLPRWDKLQSLLKHAAGLPGTAEVQTQADAIRDHRQLLDTTDPVPHLCATLYSALHKQFDILSKQAEETYQKQLDGLAADDSWMKLGVKNLPAREAIAQRHRLAPPPVPVIGTEDHLIAELYSRSLDGWQELTAALPTRFEQARRDAARELEPKAQHVRLPSATIKSKEDLAVWLKTAEQTIAAKLSEGPVIL